MESPISRRSISACRESSHLIRGRALHGPLLVAGLQPGGNVVYGSARAAVHAQVNVSTECFQLEGTELLAGFENAEAVADHLAGAGVAALLDLGPDELLECSPMT
jgi:hypothetical protein